MLNILSVFPIQFYTLHYSNFTGRRRSGISVNPITADCANEDLCSLCLDTKKVQVGKDQEKAQSERDSHSKTGGGKKPN